MREEVESSPIKEEDPYSPGDRCHIIMDDEEEDDESFKEDLSLREDLGLNASPEEETPPRDDQNRIPVQTKVSSFIKEYESCEGM